MKYLRDLIERFGKALRIKTDPHQEREGSASANRLGPVQGPVQQDRP